MYKLVNIYFGYVPTAAPLRIPDFGESGLCERMCLPSDPDLFFDIEVLFAHAKSEISCSDI